MSLSLITNTSVTLHFLLFNYLKNSTLLLLLLPHQALTFVSHIRTLGDALISRLRYPQGSAEEMGFNYLQEVTGAGARKNAGKFVVLHLRFDKVLHFLHLISSRGHLCIQGCNVHIFIYPFICETLLLY